jgi:hypothetical protein
LQLGLRQCPHLGSAANCVSIRASASLLEPFDLKAAFSTARCVAVNSSNCPIRAWNSGDFIMPARDSESPRRASRYIMSDQSKLSF